MADEKRRARRIILDTSVVIEPIGMPKVELHENLAAVYERVKPNEERLGTREVGRVRDLSTNGAFLALDPVPLLSRVACSFELEGFGRVEAIGWTLWRRASECKVPGSGGEMVTLPAGFGVLFEAIRMEARVAIDKLVASLEAGAS